MVETIHERLERERKAVFPAKLGRQIATFRKYALGRQAISLSREQRRILRGVLGHDFADNICRKILSVTTGRTQLMGWRVDDDQVADFLDGLWARNNMRRMQSQVTYATLRDGNHAVSLTWRQDEKNPQGGRVQLFREQWWDGKEGIFISYNDFDEPVYACKEWKEFDPVDGKEKHRRVFYWPDRIDRYVLEGLGWRRYTDPETGIAGSTPWLKLDGSPLGIPVVHFSHTYGDEAPYGISDLDGGVLAFQDQINSIQYDITAASSYAGYQMTWSTGTIMKTDPETGRTIPPEVGPGQHWHAEEADAKIGVIPPGDLSQLRDAYLTKLQAVCRMTDTPLHFITGQWPSGEALLRAEIDLVEKSRRLIEGISSSWVEVAHRGTEIINRFGTNVDLDEDQLITAEFTDPQRRDRLTMSQIANLEEAYTSKQERLRITGRTSKEIDQIIDEMAEEAEASMDAMSRAMVSGDPAATGIQFEEDEDEADRPGSARGRRS